MDEITRKSIESFDIPSPFRSRTVVDFAFCVGVSDLEKTLHDINCSGYHFLGATQAGTVYTVFFRRPAA